MDKYLISDLSYQRAISVSKQLRLRADEWEFIPFSGELRDQRLRGRRVSDPKYLVGPFTEREKIILTRPL
jgi:hypothetical protein